jgi:hypothetical protein
LRHSADEEVLVAINFSNRPFFGSVEVAAAERFADITPDIGKPLPPDAPAPEKDARARTSSLPVLSLESYGYRIFRRTLK